MKNTPLILFSLLCISCGDFFKSGDNPSEKTQPPANTKLIDAAKACDYGSVRSQDTRQIVLWNLMTERLCPKVREFNYQIQYLHMKAEQMCSGDPTLQGELESQWRKTALSFQYLAANPFGPLHANGGALGQEINSWPSYNKHSLNAELIRANAQGEAYNPRLEPTRKGLMAIENLIYNPSATLQPGLSGQLRPDEEIFNGLPEEERLASRCRVLRVMIADVARNSDTVFRAWAKGGGEYPEAVMHDMRNGRSQMILNELSDALMYIERVKDNKLGMPLGLNPRCRNKPKCPEDVEHFASGFSVEALTINLEAFQQALIGSPVSPGFARLLKDVGRNELAEDLTSRMNLIFSDLKLVQAAGRLDKQIESIDSSQCTNSPDAPALCRLFFQLKAVTAIYKSDFMSALNLQPPRTEMDND